MWRAKAQTVGARRFLAVLQELDGIHEDVKADRAAFSEA
jgi:hypothetical protein